MKYILHWRFRAAALLCAGMLSVPALAQQTAPQPLTLSAALDLAQKQNLDLVAARQQRAVALAGVRIAGERPNPTIDFPISRNLPHESLFVDQPLEIGGQRGKRIDLAKQESALTETDIAAMTLQVRASVRDAYFALAFARSTTAQKADILKLSTRLHDIAQSRFDAGDVAQIEVVQADLETARAQADFQVAQQEEKVALSELNALLNEPPTTDWNLGDALSTPPPTYTLDELLIRAASSSPALLRISQEEKVAKSDESLLKAQRIPNLTVEAGADFNSPPDYHAAGRAGLVMDLPIFFRNQGEITQSLAAQQALEGQLAAARRATNAKIESAYFGLESRRLQVQLYSQTVIPTSQRLEDMAEDSYQSGKTNILTVLSAQSNVQQVQANYLASLLAMQASLSQLEQAVGAPID